MGNPVAATTQTTDMEYDDDDTARIEENRQMIERIMLQKKVQKQKQKEAAQVAGTDDMDGVFAPAVVLTKEVMGVKNLNTLRARVVKEHTTIISKFTDTADTSFGDTVLKLLFELATRTGTERSMKWNYNVPLTLSGVVSFPKKPSMVCSPGRKRMDTNWVSWSKRLNYAEQHPAFCIIGKLLGKRQCMTYNYCFKNNKK